MPSTGQATDNAMVQLVWFKRDLRHTDHRPLAEAAAAHRLQEGSAPRSAGTLAGKIVLTP